MDQDKRRDLPGDPDEIIGNIRKSGKPSMEAFAYGRSLMQLTQPEKKDFWYKSELNLLATILLYVSKAEKFVPALVATGYLQPDGDTDIEGKRTAAEVIHCMEDPVTFRRMAEAAINSSREDNKLLLYGYNAYMTSKVRDNVASNLAVESEIIEYLTYGG